MFNCVHGGSKLGFKKYLSRNHDIHEIYLSMKGVQGPETIFNQNLSVVHSISVGRTTGVPFSIISVRPNIMESVSKVRKYDQ